MLIKSRKQKLLDVHHESDWPNSTQIFNEKAAMGMMRWREQLRAFCEVEVNIVIKIFIQKGNDKRW